MDLQTMLNVILTLGFVGLLCKVRKLERDLCVILQSIKKDLEDVIATNAEIIEKDYQILKEHIKDGN